MRAIKGTLFFIVLAIYVLDAMFPFVIRGCVKWRDASHRTPKLDDGSERKAIYVRAKVLNILGQGDMVVGR